MVPVVLPGQLVSGPLGLRAGLGREVLLLMAEPGVRCLVVCRGREVGWV